MKIVDRPVVARFEEMPEKCLRVFSCAEVVCPLILPPDGTRVVDMCGRGFAEAIRVELVDVCAAKFYVACDKFGDLVGPICPFDPPDIARFHKLTIRIDELQAQVKELKPKTK